MKKRSRRLKTRRLGDWGVLVSTPSVCLTLSFFLSFHPSVCRSFRRSTRPTRRVRPLHSSAAPKGREDDQLKERKEGKGRQHSVARKDVPIYSPSLCSHFRPIKYLYFLQSKLDHADGKQEIGIIYPRRADRRLTAWFVA